MSSSSASAGTASLLDLVTLRGRVEGGEVQNALVRPSLPKRICVASFDDRYSEAEEVDERAAAAQWQEERGAARVRLELDAKLPLTRVEKQTWQTCCEQTMKDVG